MNGSLKLLFIINSRSGANNLSWQDIISNYFTGKPHELHYFYLEKKSSDDELKKNIQELSPDRIIAVGGDGTVSYAGKLVAGTKAALGILPAGSANGMAKELNIPEDAAAALAIVETGEAGYCDAIMINGKEICLHLADIGINAQFIKYFEEGKLRGWLGYAKVMLKTLWRSQKIRITIDAAEKKIKTKAFMVVLANASKYGTGAVINPEGQLDDGEFEIVIVYKLSFIEVLKTIFKPKSVDNKKIEVFHTKSITIQTGRRSHFQIDGEYVGKINEVRAEVIPRYLKIIRPIESREQEK